MIEMVKRNELMTSEAFSGIVLRPEVDDKAIELRVATDDSDSINHPSDLVESSDPGGSMKRLSLPLWFSWP
jgi:hypothetical protein